MIDYEIRERLCVLRLNRPPLNIMDLAMLEVLREKVAQAVADESCDATVLIGSEEHFSGGADIHLFEKIHSRNDAKQLSRQFQEVFQAIEDSPKPVVAALAGHVMGGALELAMACHRRISTPDAVFSLPEVRLGILPGAGGTQRLTRLVGPAKALDLLLTGRSVGTREALRLGLLDRVASPHELLDGVRALLAEHSTVRRTRDQKDKISEEDLRSALQDAEKAIRNAPREVIAPSRIASSVTVGIRDSFAVGLAADQDGFADCMETTGARNRIYAFFATRQTAKLPELADSETRPIEQAAVIGMGSMGTGITQALASAGVPVTVFDEAIASVERALGRIGQSLKRRVESGKLNQDKAEATLARITAAEDLSAIREADLIIESVFEMLEVKQGVLQAIESVCRDDTIVATNTSTLSLDRLAEAMRVPGRLIGMHFFNPAHSMPLVEVIRREGTSPEVVATTVQFTKRLRKTPVLVNNREGFLVNRVFVPYLVEAFALLAEGAAARDIDDAMVSFGFPMGPLTLSDMTGIDIVVHAHRELHKAFPYHGPLSEVAHQLVAMGRTGQKGGAGVYRYEPGNKAALDDPQLAEIVGLNSKNPSRSVEEGHASKEPAHTSDAITARLVGRMVAEAFRVLEENVARSEADLDAAMVLGTGFPDYRGGIVRYARDRGLDTVLQELENLSTVCSERYAPSNYLRELVKASS